MIRSSKILDARGRPIMVNRGDYDASTQGAVARHWRSSHSGPNRALAYSLATIRNRSRAADRNHPWLWHAVDKLVSNEVGVGVTLRSACENESAKDQADTLWKTTRDELDPQGVLNFGGLQSQLVRSRRIAGEVFIRRLPRRMSSALTVPFQVQALEAEQVPENYNRDLNNGNRVRYGIESDRQGRRVAYWVYREHPYDDHSAVDVSRLERVLARDMIHHYQPTRPGQQRGEPISTRSMVGAQMFDEYEYAELTRKKTRAPFTGFLTREAFKEEDFLFDPFTGAPLSEDSLPSVDVREGTILTGFPGEKLTLFDGDRNGDGFDIYARAVLLKIAAGLGVPYELLSGDWSKVNDRLVRAILNEFRRTIEAAQDHYLIFQVCRGIWKWFIDAAVFCGKLNAPGYAAQYRNYQVFRAKPHEWPYVHPEQDANAKIKLLESRLTSREEIRDGMPGASIEEIDQQNKNDPELQQSSNNRQSNSSQPPAKPFFQP